MAELSKAIARLMEERERTQPQVTIADAPQLREVLELVRAKVPAGERALANAFVRQLFDKAGAEWLSELMPPALAERALAGFRFVMPRLVEEPRVLVLDPELSPEVWPAPCTVVQTLMRDRPFIVDTVRECLRQSGCTVQRFLHPKFAVERDHRGTVLAIGPPGALGRKESLVYVEVERVPDPDALAALLMRRLGDVVVAVDDYQAMRAKAEEAAAELRTRALRPPWNADIDEIAAFLDWLGQKSFVFLGYREYEFAGQGAERTAAVRRGSGLGILRTEERSTFYDPQSLPEALRRRLNEPPLLIVSKTNSKSPIHRSANMDYLGIKEVDSAGVVVGERRFLGLFTSRAYGEDAATIPLLRRKLSAIIEAEGAEEGSHDYKAIVGLFNSMPKVELLATSVVDLQTEVRAILAAEGGTDLKVLCRPDALGRGVFVLVILPRERFSNDLYLRVTARFIQALSATVLDQHLAIDDGDQVRMHFYLAAPATSVAAVSAEDLRTRVSELLQTWDDRLRHELREHFSREQARLLATRYAGAFSSAYKAATNVSLAVRDIQCLEALLAARAPQVDLINDDGDARFTTVKLYLAAEELVLSDFLPVLENLGLKVFAEDSLDVTLPEIGTVRIHSFHTQDAAGAQLDLEQTAPLLKPALLMLHDRRIENDGLNALIVRAGVDWRQVDLLRTYVNHGVQIGSAPRRGALIRTLTSWPRSARLLWDYFEAKFDVRQPTPPRERLTNTLPEIEQRFFASVDEVQSVADDRMLRALFSAVAATVRTNFFRAAPEPGAPAADQVRPALAVKLDSPRIAHLPRPHPVYEIYVHAPHVEGVHLRGAKVARGGIRLSDRPDDFRTEILGLMRTQMVKNAVIVPAGAKGGFIAKRRGGMPLAPAQVVTAYRTFIGALLQLTDNIVHGRLVPPQGVLVYDDPDPYLVVAADKGTAGFSDFANEVAAAHNFWLGDAFASGGTHGYDHKKEGITARGVWECVRRHFREIGRDAAREPITVVGIGDMSGDVFGNGLLLSRSFLLRAAFNHQHIFLDPTPDPALSFSERERLFWLPRSSWADYALTAISEGGGVFLRSAKKVPLSVAARAMLGLEADAPSGEEVVRAILRMDADLLWNGGIGTYVKATDETDVAVGDSTNDSVRANAAELRVRVVAEGGNRGFTPRARIEFALRGGRINTDAIDNSAGVDMSDHEVNLKIALAAAIDAGQLTLTERNQLLSELTPEVTRRVLAHNRRQARALGLDQLRSQSRLDDFRELMRQLESTGMLERQLEHLPDRDALRDRRGAFLGLTRPELAVLLAYSKLMLQQRLLASELPDDAFFERYLREYFPDVVNARFGQGVRSHRLRREIIAVEIANAVVDTMGAAFVARVARDTDADAAAVTRAWAVVMAVSGTAELWSEIGAADPPLPVSAEARCWLALEAAIERATKWVIETQPADISTADLGRILTAPVEELLRLLPHVLPATAREQLAADIEALAACGTPRALAQRIVPLGQLAELFEIAHVAAEVDAPRDTVAEIYYRVEDMVDLDWLRRTLSTLPAEDRWDRRAIEGLNEGVVYARRQLTRNVLLSREDRGQVEDGLLEYIHTHEPEIERLRGVIDDIKSAPRHTLAALLVVMRALDRLVGRAG